jgi:RNA polymerase sigma-70 factor (ECF subfamily)
MTEATSQRILVEQAQRGDHAAFAALVDLVVRRLDGVAWLMLHDAVLAEDAVQDALLRAWRDLPGLRDPERFDAWVHRLAVNACLDLARRKRRRPIEVELDPLDAPVEADASGALADRQQLEQALGRLDPGHRAVVVLHYYVGMSLPEIGRALSIPHGTVKSRMHHARRALRASVVALPEPTEPAIGGQLA